MKNYLNERIKKIYTEHKFPLTVEPIVFFYSMSFGLTQVKKLNSRNMMILKDYKLQVIRSSLLSDKICNEKLDYNSTICDNLTNDKDILHEVQKDVTDYEAQYGILSLIPR